MCDYNELVNYKINHSIDFVEKAITISSRVVITLILLIALVSIRA